MKKQTLASAALVLMLLAGCAGQPPSYDDTGNGSHAESSTAYSKPALPDSGASSFLAGEERESPIAAKPSEEEKLSASPQGQAEIQPETESSKPKQEEQAISAPSSPPVTVQEKEPASQPEQPKSTITAPSEPVAAESQPQPATTEPEAPAFDVSGHVQFAKEYGLQIGLALDSTATACWDDPLTANAGCRYLERDLKDRLDWYKQSGFNAFWVWAEQVAAGEYLVYIGYA